MCAFPGGSDSKESACNAGDLGLIPGLGRAPGGEHGNPLQYSCLENPHGQRSLSSVQSLSRVWLFVTPWTIAHQAPLSVEILQARIKWVAMSSSRGSSQPRDWIQVSCIAGGFFTSWATRETPNLVATPKVKGRFKLGFYPGSEEIMEKGAGKAEP